MGEKGEELHRKVGKSLKLENGDLVILIGRKARWMAEGILESQAVESQVIVIEEKESAVPIVEDFQGAIFFKGSRSHQLESLVPEWATEIESQRRNPKC